MRTRRSVRDAQRVASVMLVVACVTGVMTVGCARVPYITRTVHQDERVVVTLQQEVKATILYTPGSSECCRDCQHSQGIFRTRTAAPTVAMVRGGGSAETIAARRRAPTTGAPPRADPAAGGDE